MYTTKFKKIKFHAAHYLPKDFGKCNNIHGHTYTVTNLLLKTDKVVDSNLVTEKIDQRFDHALLAPLTDYEYWNKIIPTDRPYQLKIFYLPETTVEGIAQAIKKVLLAIDGVKSVSFELYETENFGAKIYE